MENSTSAPGNVTLMFSYKVDNVAHICFVIISLLCFTIFCYFIAIMLKVFFTTPHMQEDPRYILFIHMLINDTLYIFLHFLVLPNVHSVYFPIIFCFILTTLGGCIFLVTPYNLALMSLERYIAICFPLKHLQLCTPKRAKYAIAVVWIIGLSLRLVNFMIAMCLADRTLYSLYVLCDNPMLRISPIIDWISTFINIFSFTMVASIIVFTYINVTLVARKVGSSRSSALKAGKTVMLHAFQLLLCLVAFIYIATEIFIKNYTNLLIFINYILFTCVPRFLSPLIYGVRDEAFRKHIGNYCTITHVCRPQ